MTEYTWTYSIDAYTCIMTDYKRKYLDVVVDIETLATSKNAPIISIGALWYDNNNQPHPFYKVNDIGDLVYQNQTKHIDIETLKWWIKTLRDLGPLVKTDFEKCFNRNLIDVDSEYDDKGSGCYTNNLISFLDFIHEAKDYATTNVLKFNIWGCSPSFDLRILEHHLKKNSMDVPWAYYNERDVRTIRDIINHSTFEDERDKIMPFELRLQSSKHNALYDCFSEIVYINNYRNIQRELLK